MKTETTTKYYADGRVDTVIMEYPFENENDPIDPADACTSRAQYYVMQRHGAVSPFDYAHELDWLYGELAKIVTEHGTFDQRELDSVLRKLNEKFPA